MIDVDYFKLYNDTYGHQEGDECLKQIANILKNELRRPGDAVCRYGGEEFVVVLPDTPVQGAEQVGETLRLAVQRAGIAHRNSKVADRVTISIGVSTMLANSRFDPRDLVECADKALYAAKTAGRNRIVVAESIQDTSVA
jgi:diguanylate cyclase (GGDEF)-like protein